MSTEIRAYKQQGLTLVPHLRDRGGFVVACGYCPAMAAAAGVPTTDPKGQVARFYRNGWRVRKGKPACVVCAAPVERARVATNTTRKPYPRKLTDEQAAELVRRYQAGENVYSLAVAFYLSREGVYRYLRAAHALGTGAQAPKVKPAPERQYAAYELLTAEEWREAYWGEDQLSALKLSRALGIGRTGVYTALRHHLIPIRSRSEQNRIEGLKGRHKGGFYKPGKPWSHCRRGHPLSGDNLAVSQSGRRRCRICFRRREREKYWRKKATTNAPAAAEQAP